MFTKVLKGIRFPLPATRSNMRKYEPDDRYLTVIQRRKGGNPSLRRIIRRGERKGRKLFKRVSPRKNRKGAKVSYRFNGEQQGRIFRLNGLNRVRGIRDTLAKSNLGTEPDKKIPRVDISTDSRIV